MLLFRKKKKKKEKGNSSIIHLLSILLIIATVAVVNCSESVAMKKYWTVILFFFLFFWIQLQPVDIQLLQIRFTQKSSWSLSKKEKKSRKKIKMYRCAVASFFVHCSYRNMIKKEKMMMMETKVWWVGENENIVIVTYFNVIQVNKNFAAFVIAK